MWALALVVDGGKVLGVVIAPIFASGRPKYVKLALRFTALTPVKAQVYQLKTLVHNGVVDDAVGRGVVGFDG